MVGFLCCSSLYVSFLRHPHNLPTLLWVVCVDGSLAGIQGPDSLWFSSLGHRHCWEINFPRILCVPSPSSCLCSRTVDFCALSTAILGLFGRQGTETYSFTAGKRRFIELNERQQEIRLQGS